MTPDRRTVPFVALLGASAAVLFVHALLALKMGEGYAIPVTIIGAIGAAVVLRGPLGQAIADRIRGGGGSDLPPEQVLNERGIRGIAQKPQIDAVAAQIILQNYLDEASRHAA